MKILANTIALLICTFLLMSLGCGGSKDGDSNNVSETQLQGDTTEMDTNQEDDRGNTPYEDILVTQVSLGTGGGALLLPDEALPEGNNLQTKTTNTPLLPDWVTPVGVAYLVEMDGNLMQPAGIRLPIPEGVNENSLVLIRTESSGKLTVLTSRVENGMLVGETPGFSTFQMGKTSLADSMNSIQIAGPSILPVNEKGHFYEVRPSIIEASLTPVWEVSGGDYTTENTEGTAIAAGMDKEGAMIVSLTVLEPKTGVSVFRSKSVSVQDLADDPEIIISLSPPDTVTRGKISGAIKATALNSSGPLNWSWTNAGGTGECIECGTSITIPGMVYETVGTEVVTVTVSDQNSNQSSAVLNLPIHPNGIVIKSFKPDFNPSRRVGWDSPAKIDSRASVVGGKTSYIFLWVFSPPGNEYVETVDIEGGVSRDEHWVDEPGDYLVTLTVTDSSVPPKSVELAGLVLVDGPSLKGEIGGLTGNPATVQAGEEVPATVTASGGVLITGGKKGTYEIVVDFGDGTGKIVKEETAWSPISGVAVKFPHTWKESGTYVLKARITDATGSYVMVTRSITVNPASAKPFTYSWWHNLGDPDEKGIVSGDYPESAMVQISGTLEAPIISWTGIDAKVVYVRSFASSTDWKYGIVTALEDDRGNPTPIQSPVNYGDYAIPNTAPTDGSIYHRVTEITPEVPAGKLETGKKYRVVVSTHPIGASAWTEFLVNEP